jgi:hypothetical protein
MFTKPVQPDRWRTGAQSEWRGCGPALPRQLGADALVIIDAITRRAGSWHPIARIEASLPRATVATLPNSEQSAARTHRRGTRSSRLWRPGLANARTIDPNMTFRDIWRPISLFFTRPLRLADIGNAWKWLRQSRKKPQPMSPPKTSPDFEPTRVVQRAGRADDGDDWRRLEQGVDISEEPLDTLPADLQEELGKRQR